MVVPDSSYEEKAVSSFDSANSKLRRGQHLASFGFSGEGELRFLDLEGKNEGRADGGTTFF